MRHGTSSSRRSFLLLTCARAGPEEGGGCVGPDGGGEASMVGREVSAAGREAETAGDWAAGPALGRQFSRPARTLNLLERSSMEEAWQGCWERREAGREGGSTDGRERAGEPRRHDRATTHGCESVDDSRDIGMEERRAGAGVVEREVSVAELSDCCPLEEGRDWPLEEGRDWPEEEGRDASADIMSSMARENLRGEVLLLEHTLVVTARSVAAVRRDVCAGHGEEAKYSEGDGGVGGGRGVEGRETGV